MTLSFLYPTALYALLLLPLLLTLPFVGRRASARTFNFWVGLALRAVVLLGLILSLAGTQVVQAVNDTTVVFVVDRSDSVPRAEQKRAEDFVRASLATMKAGDRAAVVVFGEEALVERLASDDTTLAPITSAPRTTHTHLASALRLALALFPEETHKRIVLLSDGLENVGHAADLVDLAVARGVQIAVMPLAPASGRAEAYLDALEAPAAVRKGQTFEIVAVIYSTSAGPASLRLFGDGKLIATRDLTLQPGDNRVSFSLTGDEPGFHRYTAELQAAGDTLPQNNVASAFSVVHGPPRVLVVENTSGDADNLIAALESAKVETERVAPAVLTGDLATLSNYDAVFLVNIPARALPDAAMNALPTYVRDLGRGLVMIGGPEAYGAGGYLRTPLEKALPVDMDVRSRTQEPNLALVFAIDKSGSMGRCHCDDPSAQPGSYARIESGLSKVDIAKDAVMQAARAVGRADYVGVVAFDANALWALRVQEMIDPDFVQQKIGGLRAEGQTNINAGLSEAEAALEQTPARLKHVVLLTDGWSRSFEYGALALRLHDKGITLSVIAAGSGSATYLEQLARQAGGRYYAARTMTEVPSLFFKETVEAAGSYIVEEPFYPAPAGATPILRGLDVTRLPALRGYNGTTPKSSAQVSLVSSQGDPLLATWQYGLGRAAAWTSDVKGQWATDWIKWNGFNTFIAQLTSWV
ncbi:MAG TPA: VWA domain-containing protein, partial [Anaerolineae bacterium]|nr:VWA domain-containing protein [Anaerolineae bacterium]